MPEYLIGQIVEQLGAPLHKIRYAIQSRGIKPSRRIGRYRLFSQTAVDRIAEVLGVNTESR